MQYTALILLCTIAATAAIPRCTSEEFDDFVQYHIDNCDVEKPGLKCTHISCANLIELPSSIGQLKAAKHMFLDGPFPSVPDEIGDLTELTSLVIADSDAETIPTSIENLKQLRSFDFGSRKMTKIPDLKFAETLTSLEISGDQVSKIPNNLLPDSLKYLYLGLYSYTGKLPSSISNLPSLLSANVEFAGSKFPDLSNSVALTSWSIRSPNLKTVPSSFGSLQSLEEFNLKGKLTNIKDVSNLGAVKNFRIGRITKKTIPEYMYAYPKLEWMDIHESSFEDLPKDLSNTNFNSFGVSYSNIDSIDALTTAPFLKRIYINRCDVKDIPVSLFSTLQTIFLRDNFLEAIPAGISSESPLESLDLSGNMLLNKDLSPLGTLSKLKYLILPRTGVSTIPNLSSINAISAADFSGNEFMELSDDLSNLPVNSLTFSSNKISQITGPLSSAVREIYLDNNNLASFPAAAIGDSCGLSLVFLDSNVLESIDSKLFTNCPSLWGFHAKNNKLTNANFDASGASSTLSLYLDNNEFDNYPKVNKVRTLSLAGNNIAAFEDLSAQSMYWLDLQSNQIASELDASWFPKDLQRLNVQNNKITTISLTLLEDLPSLNELLIGDNALGQIPDAFFVEHEKLSILQASGIGLNSLPTTLSNLKSLYSIDISRNNIAVLPETELMKQYSFFNISENPIEDLTALTGLEFQMLDISGIQWKKASLPDFEEVHAQHLVLKNVGLTSSNIPDISASTSRFDCSFNSISKIPKRFFVNNPRLFEVNFSNNNIKSLSSNVFSDVPYSSDVKEIDLSVNKLTSLPSSFTNLNMVHKLNLSNNKFSKVPNEIAKLRRLDTLDLSGNKIKTFSSGFLEDLKKIGVRTLFLKQSVNAKFPCAWKAYLGTFVTIDILVEDLKC